MSDWSFLTNHARALLFLVLVPDARLRDMADALQVTERTAFGLVADLTDSGYLVKEKDGRRNRYTIQSHLPLRDPVGTARPIGEVLALLATATKSRGGAAPKTKAAPTKTATKKKAS